jgi:hypothetical protein
MRENFDLAIFPKLLKILSKKCILITVQIGITVQGAAAIFGNFRGDNNMLKYSGLRPTNKHKSKFCISSIVNQHWIANFCRHKTAQCHESDNGQKPVRREVKIVTINL